MISKIGLLFGVTGLIIGVVAIGYVLAQPDPTFQETPPPSILEIHRVINGTDYVIPSVDSAGYYSTYDASMNISVPINPNSRLYVIFRDRFKNITTQGESPPLADNITLSAYIYIKNSTWWYYEPVGAIPYVSQLFFPGYWGGSLEIHILTDPLAGGEYQIYSWFVINYHPMFTNLHVESDLRELIVMELFPAP
ncbi:MAG: hypothetical protein HWN65_17005 [Candidatus Helarchaeota archaeon]|nr:hypothetical protein [Candidatus Helarchaeota archaeon]